MNRIKRVISILCALTVLLAFNISLVDAESKYADGEYNLPFTVLKGDSDERSMTNDYLVSPAKLTVKNGQYIIQMTLKNSSWWKDFKVGSKDVKVLSDSNDTRIVEFPVSDIDKIVNAHIHVIVPDINYDNKYDVRFKFDTSGISEGKQKIASSDPGKKVDNGNADKSNENNNEESNQKEENPPTGDETPILLLSTLLLMSGLVIVRKIAFR